jgi:hypothetical protein
MGLVDQSLAIKELKDAFNSRNLTIYLGAGVSMPSGLPSWEQLVLLLYFRTLNADINYRVFPNYLLAISEWLLKTKNEPLDIILRKIKNSGWNENTFVELIQETLYSGFNVFGAPQIPSIDENKTLSAIINNLCRFSTPQNIGLKSIVTYNYDNLLEIGLELKGAVSNFQIIWSRSEEIDSAKIPIYHVHGYIPIVGKGSTIEEMIFSEEQYNNAFQDAYYWGNMVQMQALSSNTGLMIGISLNDRNIRRILDSIKKSPILTKNYLLLQKTKPQIPLAQSSEAIWIHDQAMKYNEKLKRSHIKVEEREYREVTEILKEISNFESMTFNNIYRDMGLEVLWYDDHDEVGDFVETITRQ